jgi:hypothetical protein
MKMKKGCFGGAEVLYSLVIEEMNMYIYIYCKLL